MKLNVRQMAVFGIMAALMFISRQVMAALPNIHLIGLFITVLTVVYRTKALFPLYTFVLMEGLFGGFSSWWLPYLYIWTVLWGAVMLLPRNMKPATAAIVYAAVCGAHGFLFGVLYAPAEALITGLTWEGMIAWIVKGLPYDVIHGLGNIALGTLAVPLIRIVEKMEKAIH